MDVKTGRGYVYSIQYHIVWVVKYRQKILNEKIETRLIEILHQIASDNNFSILELNTDSDHIHILIDCTPQHYIPNLTFRKFYYNARIYVGRYFFCFSL